MPKYIAVQQKILNYIGKSGFSAGSKLPTEKELSSMFNVSTITVRRSLAELEANNIVERIHGRGTFCKINLKNSQPLKTISYLSIGKTFQGPHSAVFAISEEELRKRGFKVKYMDMPDEPDKQLTDIDNDCGGIILDGWVTQKWVDYVLSLGVPVVTLSCNDFDGSISSVYLDYGAIVEMVMAQMLKVQACKNIGIYIYPEHKYKSEEVMFEAYRDFLLKNDLPINPQNWCASAPSPEQYYQCISDFILNRDEPLDALIIKGHDSYIHLLNFLFENPGIKMPLVAVLLSEGSFYQLQFANLQKTICAFPAQSIGEVLVDTLFNYTNQKTNNPRILIGGKIRYKGQWIEN